MVTSSEADFRAPLHPLRDFHDPKKWCATSTSGSACDTPSSPLGCVPKDTLGSTRTFHASGGVGVFVPRVRPVAPSSSSSTPTPPPRASSSARAASAAVPHGVNPVAAASFARECFQNCRMTTSVNAPGPVRSSVSRLVLLVKTRWTLRATWSQISRSAGCPGAPAKTQLSTCRRRTKCREYAISSVANSPSHPTTSVSVVRRNSSNGRRHSVSMSA